VSPMRYELGFYTAEDGILHSHRCENLKSYIVLFSFVPVYIVPGGISMTILDIARRPLFHLTQEISET
jgi:hypothetical protein